MKRPTDRQIRKYAHMIIERAKGDPIVLEDIFNDILPGIVYESFFMNTTSGGSTKKHQYQKRDDGILKFNISKEAAKKAKINPYHRQEYTVYVANYYELSERLPPIEIDSPPIDQEDGYIMTKILIHSRPSAKHRKQFEIFGFLRVLTKLDPDVLLRIEGRMLAHA